VLLISLVACGPEHAEPPPEDWFLGEWFVWGDLCPEECRPHVLVQVEVEPNGVGVIHKESICNPESREELTWVAEAPDLLRFEPLEPTTNGLQMPDFEFFTLRYEDDCRAVGEESINTFQLRRGPVRYDRENPLDCIGVIVPEDETTNLACLEAE